MITITDPSPLVPLPWQQDRIHNLDTLRGVAVLGILIMNGVAFALGTTSYFNISFDTDAFTLDRSIAMAGEIIADQKFMALFSILFGSGIVLFHERLKTRHGNTKAVRISLWRNTLLLLMGVIHTWFWNGDVLLIYAIVAPLVLVARNLTIAALLTSGIGILLLSPMSALAIQFYLNAEVQPLADALGEYWIKPDMPIENAVGFWLLTDFVVRALGMMLIGIGLYRTGFLSGASSTHLYVSVAASGTLLGWLLSASGVLWVTAERFSNDIALIGGIPNTLGALPTVLGYIAIVSLSAKQLPRHWLHRLQAVGRMALSNYLTQTLLGLLVFAYLVETPDVSRTKVALFIVFVWILQLWWSARWLGRYTQGPIEWLWRCATHRCLMPLRRDQVLLENPNYQVMK